MVKVNYKYVTHGERFIFEGKEYIKSSHSRGKYLEDGRTIHRNFKKLTVVESEVNYDVIPPLR